MGAAIISGVIFGICALIMVGIGIYQIKSKKPVAFYTGEKAPDEKQLTDWKAWNREHGIMWILYGVCIMLAWVCGLVMGDNLLAMIPYLIGLLLPIPVMIWNHHRLERKYVIR